MDPSSGRGPIQRKDGQSDLGVKQKAQEKKEGIEKKTNKFSPLNAFEAAKQLKNNILVNKSENKKELDKIPEKIDKDFFKNLEDDPHQHI